METVTPKKRHRTLPTEKEIVRQFADIAFSDETKDSDRLRALDWLSDYLDKERERKEVMDKLDEVLKLLS